jgi:adenylate cyclase
VTSQKGLNEQWVETGSLPASALWVNPQRQPIRKESDESPKPASDRAEGVDHDSFKAAVLYLVVCPRQAEEKRFELGQGRSTIGRGEDNVIQYRHQSLSRRHAELCVDEEIVRVTDLRSKNGLYYKGRRVVSCDVSVGEAFRCGDVVFAVERKSARVATLPVSERTLISSSDGRESSVDALPNAPTTPNAMVEGDRRYRDRAFVLIRATELCVSNVPLDRMLDELVGLALAMQVMPVDRIVLCMLDAESAEMKPRVVKALAGRGDSHWSGRVINAIVNAGAASMFSDVSADTSLGGDRASDAHVRAALASPINPGNGVIGVLYADSLSLTGCFDPDDLSLLRALANLAALAIDGAAFRSAQPHTSLVPP